MEVIEGETNGIIKAPTGFGKTVVAINLISKLNLKTLIIVNKIGIANNLVKEIDKFLNFSDVESYILILIPLVKILI